MRDAPIADQTGIELRFAVFVEGASMLVAKEPAEDCIRVDAFRGQKRGDVIAERLRIIELGRVSGYWLMMRQENVLLSVALFEDFDQPVALRLDRSHRSV